jgi:outer membrane protein assembly factor BamD
MRRVSVVFILILGLFVAFSCSKFRKIEKNPDWRVKYEAGLAYYAKKDYYRTSILFEQILPIVRGLPEAEKVQFYLAYCQYYEKLYLLAAEQFKSFYETYGRGTLSEEARFMYAYSLYKSSPGPSLDQTESIEAMTSMQDFLNRFPNSKFKDQALEVIYTVQVRLEKKGFENARQYAQMRQYKASIVALDNFQKNFPDSKYLEESYFLVVQSKFELARESVASKQRERYQDVLQSYRIFVDRFPDSKFLKEAERYYVNSNSILTTLKIPNS